MYISNGKNRVELDPKGLDYLCALAVVAIKTMRDQGGDEVLRGPAMPKILMTIAAFGLILEKFSNDDMLKGIAPPPGVPLPLLTPEPGDDDPPEWTPNGSHTP